MKKKSQALGYVGLHVSESGVAVTLRSGPAAVASLTQTFFAHANQDNWAQQLQEIVADNNLAGCPTNLVLHPGDYKMLLVEKPDVEDSDLRDAVKWRIKDFIDFPLEDAIVDAFPVPKGQRGPAMCYVAVVKRERLASLVETIESSGLVFDCIDIPELILRNIAFNMADNAPPSAVVWMSRRRGSAVLCVSDTLYFTRSFEIGTESLAEENPLRAMEGLVSELQRSFDYFETQLGQQPIKRILLSPSKESIQMGLSNYLNSQLNVAAIDLSVRELMSNDADTDFATVGQTFLSIGAALRLSPEEEAERAAS